MAKQHSGKMTESIYLEVSENTEAAQKAGRWVSVSEMLKFLGISRSGYLAWLHHVPSDTGKRREAVKAKISHLGKNRWYIYAPNGNSCSVEQTMDDHHKRFRFQH